MTEKPEHGKHPCVVDGCEKPSHVAAGYCAMHHARIKRTGDCGPAQRLRRTQAEIAADPRIRCTAPKCGTMFEGGACPNCGRVPVGTLVRLTCSDCGKRTEANRRRGKAPTRCKECTREKRSADQQVERLLVTHFERTCPDCGATFVVPSRRGLGRGGSIQRLCLDCAERHRRQAVKPKEDRRRLRRHGLSVETYREILDRQGGRCGICAATDPGGKGTWHVDHDHLCCPGQHSCGRCIRGLLCALCNPLLGYAQDNVDHLRAAIRYLQEPPGTEIAGRADRPEPGRPTGPQSWVRLNPETPSRPIAA